MLTTDDLALLYDREKEKFFNEQRTAQSEAQSDRANTHGPWNLAASAQRLSEIGARCMLLRDLILLSDSKEV